MFDRQSHVTVEAVRAQVDAGLRDEPVDIPIPEPQEEPEQTPDQEQEAVDTPNTNASVEEDRAEQNREDEKPKTESEETVEEKIKAVRQESAQRFIEKIENKRLPESEATEETISNTTHTGDHAKTHQLLEDILMTARKVQRNAMFQESSVSWTLALAMQIVAIGLVILSVVFLLGAEKNMPAVYTTMGYAVITQLIVIALCLMDRRK